MGACQRELGTRMIEIDRQPAAGCVTLQAVMAEAVDVVIRIGHRIVITVVAGIAVGRSIVIAVGVALYAIQRNMRPGQREQCLRMVEGGRQPGVCRMANRAVMIEVIGYVVRLSDGVVVGFVARETICRRIIVAVRMTGLAGETGVRAGQRKSRLRVIETNRQPAVYGMALGTVVAETIEVVIRIRH